MFVLLHPTDQVGSRSEINTERKDPFEALARNGDHLPAKVVDVAVKVAEKRQVRRKVLTWQTIRGSDVVERQIFKHQNTRKVQPFEPSERDDVVVGVRGSRRTVH